MLIIVIVVVLLIGVLVVVLVSAEKQTVYAECPSCNKRIGLLKGVGACENCGVGLQSLNGGFKTPPAGFVADFPAFLTNLAKLKPTSACRPVWTGLCCVCGRPAVRQEKISIKSVKAHVGSVVAPTNVTQTGKLEVGYCSAHQDGVRFTFPPGMGYAKSNSQCWLSFRSFDYYREFMQTNGKVNPAAS